MNQRGFQSITVSVITLSPFVSFCFIYCFSLASALNGANISQSARSVVFAHIEGVLHWKRKSLMRRLKKLNETNEDQKIHPLLDALCDAISRAMPALLESYLRDKELHAERLKTWQAENAEPVEALSTNPDGTAPKRNPKPGAPKKLFRWNTECSTSKPIPSTAIQLPTSCSTNSVNAQSVVSGNLSSGLSKGKPPQGSNRLTATSPNVHTSMGVTVSQSRSPIGCTSSVPSTVPVSERNGSTQSPTLGNLSGSLTSVAAKVSHPQQAVRSMLQPRPDQPVVERQNYSPKQNTRIGSPPIIHSAVKTTTVKTRTIGSVPVTNEARMSLLVQNISAQQLSAPIMSNVIKYSSPPVHVNQTYPMQQKMPDNTARQPSPVVCGSVHLTSTSSVSLADTCKPTATVSGKVQRMPDSADSRGMQYFPHPRRQTEPGVLQKYISLAPNSMPTGHLSTLNAANLITQTPASAVQVANSFVSAQGNSAHLYSSSALALATNQINQLQQRAIASTVRPALKMNSTLAAATNVLLQRQPPPAHQQVAPSQGFPQRSTDCYIALLPSAHASPYTNTSNRASSKPPITGKTCRCYLSCCYTSPDK
ncbi:hypothetical protein AHF37_06601 [Paragonimus kellicotti]|nr:hypothetical protein AHF37_06601 [Paragonimus kellicotti]